MNQGKITGMGPLVWLPGGSHLRGLRYRQYSELLIYWGLPTQELPRKWHEDTTNESERCWYHGTCLCTGCRGIAHSEDAIQAGSSAFVLEHINLKYISQLLPVSSQRLTQTLPKVLW
jgi:hypothetical protein